MSALQRSRSTSITVPTGENNIGPSKIAVISTLTEEAPDPSPAHSPAPLAATSPSAMDSDNDTIVVASVLSALPAQPLTSASLLTDARAFDDPADNRSSSLSELGDASDDQSEPTPRVPAASSVADVDSEAETERIEVTPRKLTRTVTNTSLASDHLYERTPSKLIHSRTVDEAESVPPTPSFVTGNAPTGNAALDALSSLAASEAATLEHAGKKRKRRRSSADISSGEELTEEPARKRNSTEKDVSRSGSRAAMVDEIIQANAEEDLEMAEDRLTALAQEEFELEEKRANVAAETVNELAAVAKLTKPRKGGRRGKRKLDDTGGSIEVVASTEPHDEIEGDHEEEDNGALEEEVSKKKNAIDELAKIERKFKVFREKLCDEQIAQYEQELEMLKQPNCTHPEYIAMIQAVDERRAGKIAYEKTLLEYKQQTLERTIIAERHQIHSQYLQTVRDVREDILSDCNQRIYELQRGRRQLGAEEIEYSLRLPEKRSDQIRHQAAYNLEVSVLAGVAKYVGFPAAPEIKAARPSEIDDDLRAMKITTRPVAQPVQYVRPYNRNVRADEVAAEEQFIESTPWANPQHPAHQQSHYTVPPAAVRAPSQTYQTPAGQRRVVDMHAPNGSASTIDITSNPPSSTAGQALPSNGRLTESESPVLQMKRHPNDLPPYLDTPGSHPRNIAGMVRDSYATNAHLLSGPAGDVPLDDQAPPRWGNANIRPLNAGASAVPVGAARQVSMPQRNSLGAVSVGSGNSLFGR
ncbi:hypothetical protein K491DRAFT_717369 [Lophiostoma macrostomum CBS 122681]|uniref:Transcriptional regulatory protein DEP1 n=1 Tax=Lophiostoma macrostomum CBS 122681 TaxID=1314788 RepID=A0A6A6T2S7_9PLEO|nr:hypothetical protein K491DRAFT_717369 [Lophiostoma macrostomum CBS 122681]